MKYNVCVSMEIHIDADTPEQAENKVIDLFDWCLCPAPLNTVVEAVEIGESETHGEIEL